MLVCNRGADNGWSVGARSSADNILLHFTSLQTDLSVYCIANDVVQIGQNTFFTFTEGTPVDEENGVIQLSPDGQWELNVYEQASTTNLDPDNATYVATEIIRVDSGETAATGFTGTCADDPGGTFDLVVNFGGVEVYSETLNTADTNTININ